MTPKQRNLLIAERAAAYARINEIAALLDADDKARYDARRAKRKPVAPPREPVGDPRVATVRDYVRRVFGSDVVAYNNRRRDHRTVKIQKAMTADERAFHARKIQRRIPDATFKTAALPYWLSINDERLQLVVVLA